MIGARQEHFNNLTGDIELNPGSFGLFMRDIDEASLNLKTAIYSGNINLTADLYKQLESLSEKKYNAIEPDGSINTTRLEDTTMTGKSAGLYMNHQRMGYWTGTDWKAFIGNNGDAFFGSITENNYLEWDSANAKLTAKGDIEANSISASAVITNTIRGGKTSYSDSTAGYWLGLDGTTPKFNLGNSTNSLNWTGTQLNIKGNITAGNISGVNISGSVLTSISNDSFTTLLIDGGFITLTEGANFSKNTIKPNGINISSSTGSEYTLILIEPSMFQDGQYINGKITMGYEGLNSSGGFITSNYDGLYMGSIGGLSTLGIGLAGITMTGVNVVGNGSRTLAGYFSAYINNGWRYVPYYN